MRRRTRSSPESGGRAAARSRRRGLNASLLAALAASFGCYRYAPTELPGVEPNAEIRVTLNNEGYQRVLPQAPSVGTQTIEGRFMELTDDSLVMSVWIGEAYRGTPFETTYQRVPLPLADVMAVEDRQLSKPRTALLAAGAIALIVTMIDRLDIIEIFGDSGSGPPQPPEPEGVIFRFRH